jgi:hypothetical protein
MSRRKPLAALAALATTAAMAVPVASASAASIAPISPFAPIGQLSSNPAATSAGMLCAMLGAQTQGAQLFGNAILTSRLQQTSGIMSCSSAPATPAFPGLTVVG